MNAIKESNSVVIESPFDGIDSVYTDSIPPEPPPNPPSHFTGITDAEAEHLAVKFLKQGVVQFESLSPATKQAALSIIAKAQIQE